MAAIVSTCCCEDDDGGGGGDDPSDFKICCEDPPEKLTISVSTVYEMQNNPELTVLAPVFAVENGGMARHLDL